MKLRNMVMAIGMMLASIVTAQDYCLTKPFGYGANATGGTGQSITLVTDLNGLKNAIKNGNGIYIITKNITMTSMIEGTGSNYTLMALPGVTITNLQQDKNNSGMLYIKQCSNIIFRNLTFVGPGAYDCNGNDGLCFDRVTKAWVDHCDFQDGCDGNFDMKDATDNITVTWCKFHYEKKPKAGGSGGTADHRFSDLIGSGKTDKPKNRRVTFAYNWWANGCVERMPRSRYSTFHMLNNYWSSSAAKVCLGLGGCTAYVEGCYFDVDKKIIYKDYSSDDGASGNKLKFVNSYGKSGLPANEGSASAPTYAYTALPYADVKAAVTNETCGAGATLTVDTKGEVSTPCSVASPTIKLTSAAATANQTVLSGTAITNITYTIGGTATGGTATGLPNGVNMTVSGSTITVAGTPTVAGTYKYTITTTQTEGTAATATGTITVTEKGTLTLTSGQKDATTVQGQNVTPIVYTWGGGAIGAEATGLPEGFTATKDASSKTLTITGTSTETLSKTTYTVTTTGAGNTVTLNGTITVTADPNAATLTSSANMTQTVTEGQSIESMTFTYGGGATGITVENLPAGLTQSTSGKTLTIAGTPTESGTFTVRTTGGSVNKTQTATVNVASAIAEDFEGETASASSSEKDINLSTGLYTFYRAKINTDYNNTEGGSNAVQLNYQKGYIITPEMIGTQTVSFYVKTKKKEATLNVSYSADGGTTWKTLENATVTSTTFIQKSYKISETGNIILKIENDGRASGSTDYNLYVDDLDFTAAGNTTSVDEEMKDEAENIDWKITGSEVTLTGAEVVKIVIYDFSSHIVIKGGEFASSVNTSGLSAGYYVAVAVLPNGKTMAKKFMKR